LPDGRENSTRQRTTAQALNGMLQPGEPCSRSKNRGTLAFGLCAAARRLERMDLVELAT
jgi:hypothetical protein